MGLGAAAVAIGAEVGFDAAAMAAVGVTADLAGSFTVLTAIGAVTSVVGAVTGNKNLQMAGMAMGIVGGVGALAGSAGLFDSGTSIFGSSAGATGNASGGIGEAVDAPTPVTTEDLPPTTSVDAAGVPTANPLPASVDPEASVPTGIINSTATTPPTGMTATPISDTSTSQLPGLTSSDVPGAAGADSGLSAEDAAAAARPGGVSPLTPGAGANVTGSAVTPSQLNSMTDLSGIDTTINQAPPGTLDSLMSFAKGNPMLAYGVVQAGGSLISGLTNPVTPAQINALNAQANANNAAAALAANQAKNNAQPLPTATVASAPVTGKPLLNNPAMPTTNPTAPGLINSQGTTPVTGTPAPLTVGAPS